MMRRTSAWLLLTLKLALVGWSSAAPAAVPKEVDRAQLQDTIAKGLAFLSTKGQNDQGSVSPQFGPGVTALAVMAFLENGRTVEEPFVAKGLKYLEGFVQADGSITGPGGRTTNYDTSICLACFALANKDGKYKATIAKATDFLRGVQRDEGEGRKPSDPDYGGAAYSGKAPGGDLSNTAMLLDALQAAGAGPDDEAVKRALIFVSRCQNLEGEHNTLEFAAKVNDGGFYYSPIGDGGSAAGKDEQGALRSYASMTYAGLKSLVFAGVGPDDYRVKAATKWLASNYSVEQNPGLGTAGLYYYYQLMSKCLEALGRPTFTDAQGVEHNWRAELAAELSKRQQADGSWTNDNERWFESDPGLATSFALLALSRCVSPQ